MTNKKETRGGAKEGSGRKPELFKKGEKTRQISFQVSEQHYEKLYQIAKKACKDYLESI